MRHRPRVDKAHADALVGFEKRGPVFARCLPIEQIGVRSTGHVRDVGRIHPHLGPQRAVRRRGAPTRPGRIAKYIGHGTSVAVVVRTELFKFGQHPSRILEGPVRQHHDALTVVSKWLRRDGVDDEGAVETCLLLIPGMAVVPVRPVLAQPIAIREGLAGCNAGEADTRDAIHLRRHEEAVPMDGAAFLQLVGHADRHGFALTKPQRGTGQHAVDHSGRGASPVNSKRRLGDHEFCTRSGTVQPGCCAR